MLLGNGGKNAAQQTINSEHLNWERIKRFNWFSRQSITGGELGIHWAQIRVNQATKLFAIHTNNTRTFTSFKYSEGGKVDAWKIHSQKCDCLVDFVQIDEWKLCEEKLLLV